MSGINRRFKSIGSFIPFEDLDISPTILSYSQIDAKIYDLYQRFHPEANISSTAPFNTGTKEEPEEMEIEKILRLMRSAQTKANVNHIINIFNNTKFPLVRTKVKEFYLNFLTRPSFLVNGSSNYSPETIASFQLFIPELYRFFENFIKEDKETILQALSNFIVDAAPSPQYFREQKSVPSFNNYEITANCCTEILRTCIKINYPKKATIEFAKMIISSIITVSINVAEVSRITHSQFSSNVVYIGSFLSFVSELKPFIEENDNDFLRLLQQYWCVSVMFSLFNTRIFNQWSEEIASLMRFMPPLIQKNPRVDFSSIKVRIMELFKLIKPNSFQETENLIPIFTNLLPNIQSKIVLQLDVADAIYALSIYLLEKTRAENGIVGPIFDYIDVEYTPTFTQILDGMLEPIFNSFEQYLNNEFDIQQRHECLEFTMSVLINKLTSKNPRVQAIADQYGQQFGLSNPTIVCSEKVLKSILSVQKQTNINEQFKSFIDKLFSESISVAPNSLFSLLFHIEYNKKSKKSNSSTNILQIIDLLSPEYRNSFMDEFFTKSLAMGKAQYIKPKDFDKIENINDRMLMIASYIIVHPNRIDLIPSFLELTDEKSMLVIWTHFAKSSFAFSNIITKELIQKFNISILKRKGIFGDEVDLDMIKFQTAQLRFFVEQISIAYHSADFASLFSMAHDIKFLDNSAIVPALIAYAYLGCSLLISTISLPIRIVHQIHIFVIRMLLITYSYINDPYLFRYINNNDLLYLEKLIELLPETVSLLSNSTTDVNNNSSTYTGSSYVTGKYSSEIKCLMNSLQKSKMNYMSNNSENFANIEHIVSFVCSLICNELQLYNSYLNSNQISGNLQRLFTLYQIKSRNLHLNTTIPIIWKLAPESIYNLCLLPRIGENIISIIAHLAEIDPFTAASVPSLALLFEQSDKFNKSNLAIWKPLTGVQALTLIRSNIMKDEDAAKYVSRCLYSFTKEESLLFLPQLVQSLRFDSCGILKKFLKKYSKQSEVFLHYLLWNILSEKNNLVNNKDNLPSILKKLEKEVIDNMNEKEHKHYENEFGFIDALDEVSQKLLPMPIKKRPSALGDMLSEMKISSSLYIPSNPNYRIISIDAEHSVPLKSHARVPILVRFNVYDENDSEKKPLPFSCIFKIQDDVRQDAMMIQFIDRFQTIFNEAGLDTYLFPYRVFATGENRGVIEVIPNAKSRHDIGRSTNEYLLQYFISKYGNVESKEFKRAQDNFIKSVAPYSILCYLFQVKDRHNANIMIDEDGHVVHIDFGFLFEISPGGNMKFERAPFKLTREMIEVMGGSRDAPPFQKFSNLLRKCFFAVKARHSEIESITYLMMSAGFPCFRADSIKKLQQRFFLDRNPKDTCTGIDQLISDSYEAVSTTAYDAFQAAQNEIFF